MIRPLKENTTKATIKISTSLADKQIAITIHDNGVGIVPQKLPHIFDPFFTTHEVGGNRMGLGLSICHAIIEKLDGTISIDSEPNAWTQFTINLPSADQGA